MHAGPCGSVRLTSLHTLKARLPSQFAPTGSLADEWYGQLVSISGPVILSNHYQRVTNWCSSGHGLKRQAVIFEALSCLGRDQEKTSTRQWLHYRESGLRKEKRGELVFGNVRWVKEKEEEEVGVGGQERPSGDFWGQWCGVRLFACLLPVSVVPGFWPDR